MTSVFFVLAVMAALPNDAQKIAVVVRAESGVDPKVTGSVESAAWSALREQVAEKAWAPPEEAAVARARTDAADLLTKARQQAEELDTEAAKLSASKAIEILKPALLTPTDASLMARAHIQLMTLAIWDKQEQAAEENARRAYVLDPKLTLDPSTASAEEETLWKRIRRQQDALPRGTLDVVCNPPGARIILDGKDVGTAPFRLPDVMPGTHHVKLISPFRMPSAVDTQVASGAVAQVQLELADSELGRAVMPALKQDPLNPPKGPWMGALSGAGIDHAVVMVLSPGADGVASAAHLVRTKDGQRLRRVERLLKTDALLADVGALLKDALDATAGAGVPGGAAMKGGKQATVTSEERVSELQGSSGEGGGIGGKLPFIVAAVALPVVALAVGVGVGIVAGGVGGYLLGHQQGAAEGYASGAAAARDARRRETANRVATQGY